MNTLIKKKIDEFREKFGFLVRDYDNEEEKEVDLPIKDDLEAWLQDALSQVERESLKESEKLWYRTVDRWYCEHCGEFLSQEQGRKLRQMWFDELERSK